jgi:hypothetical protein
MSASSTSSQQHIQRDGPNAYAETKGLVNFSHEVGSAKDGAVISLAWAKTTLASDKAQSKTVQIGWVYDI